MGAPPWGVRVVEGAASSHSASVFCGKGALWLVGMLVATPNVSWS
jgi:hypothetical protein